MTDTPQSKKGIRLESLTFDHKFCPAEQIMGLPVPESLFQLIRSAFFFINRGPVVPEILFMPLTLFLSGNHHCSQPAL